MDDEVINAWANIPALLAAAGCVATLLLYGVGSPWYRTLLGVVFFGVVAVNIPVFGIIFGRRIFGMYPGYGTVALVTYSFAALAWWSMFVMVLIERRSDHIITLPIKKDRKHDRRKHRP